MQNLILSPAKFAFAVATRAALAFGAGLLISRRLTESQRRTVGRTLLTVGALTTIPVALMLRGSRTTSR